MNNLGSDNLNLDKSPINRDVDFSSMTLEEISLMFRYLPNSMVFVNELRLLTPVQRVSILNQYLLADDRESVLSDYKAIMLCRLISKDASRIADIIINSYDDDYNNDNDNDVPV